jgi:hypothetical protein
MNLLFSSCLGILNFVVVQCDGFCDNHCGSFHHNVADDSVGFVPLDIR